MNDVTIRVGEKEEVTTFLHLFDPTENPWCVIGIHPTGEAIYGDGGCAVIRFESHPSSLLFLDQLRYQLEEVSKYLRGVKE